MWPDLMASLPINGSPTQGSVARQADNDAEREISARNQANNRSEFTLGAAGRG